MFGLSKSDTILLLCKLVSFALRITLLTLRIMESSFVDCRSVVQQCEFCENEVNGRQENQYVSATNTILMMRFVIYLLWRVGYY